MFVLDVNGVGYVIACSARTLRQIGPAKTPASLLIDTNVREDAINLYGFIDGEEQDWFKLLTTVQGVGAKVALSILSSVSPEQLAQVIASQDKTALTQADGVGPKLALRLVTELKDKVPAFASAPVQLHGAKSGGALPTSAASDAVSALVNLGYRRAEAFAAVASAGRREPQAKLDELIRLSLAELSRKESAALKQATKPAAPERLVEREALPQEPAVDNALRPQRLDEFVGQSTLRANLGVFIQAAKGRKQPLDHVLLFGPPGLGKTTLAQIIAKELGVNFRATSGPVIARAGDLAALLTNLQPQDVLFIDEIHRLPAAVEEILYPAMEDFQLDLIIGEGPAARSVRIDLPPFTLVGATTRSGLITRPLRERFGIPMRLQFYTPEELQSILCRAAEKLDMPLTKDGASEIARRARGTPRVAGRLLRRVRDFASVAGHKSIDDKAADAALTRLEVDRMGFDSMDRRYLSIIAENYGGGPVGVETLCAALSEQRDVLEEVIEPYLIQQGLLQRTPRGRMVADAGYRYLGLTAPAGRQIDLLVDEAPAIED